MLGPEYTAGCPSCSAIADGFDGSVVHLDNHDVTLCAVSRAPLAKLQAYRRRMGWTFPWGSSAPSDFNYDFGTSITEEQQRSGVVEYNYRSMDVTPMLEAGDSPIADIAAALGTDAATYTRELPGMSAFGLEDGVVYHTYSAYARGLDGLWGMYQWRDRAPRGRNESLCNCPVRSAGGITSSKALELSREASNLSPEPVPGRTVSCGSTWPKTCLGSDVG